jgi:hypothetical protein
VSLSEMAGEPSCAWKSLSPGALASGQIPMRKMEASTKGHPITRLTSRFISALLLRFIHCFRSSGHTRAQVRFPWPSSLGAQPCAKRAARAACKSCEIAAPEIGGRQRG